MEKSDCEELCNEILGLSKSIRFIEIFDDKLTIVKKRKGLKSLLTDKESRESISHTIMSWDYRKQLIAKLGNVRYSMTSYNKVKRMSVPLHKTGIILFSMDPDEPHEEIISKILKLKMNYV